MTATTQETVSVEIGLDLAQAVWAAAGERDDLAQQWVEFACVFGLHQFMRDVPATCMGVATREKLRKGLQVTRRRLDAITDAYALDMAEAHQILP